MSPYETSCMLSDYIAGLLYAIRDHRAESARLELRLFKTQERVQQLRRAVAGLDALSEQASNEAAPEYRAALLQHSKALHRQQLAGTVEVDEIEDQIQALRDAVDLKRQQAAAYKNELERTRHKSVQPALDTPLLAEVEALVASSPGYRVMNATHSKSLPTFDIHMPEDDVKIASIICHSASIAGKPLFSVAGFRTKNGSPNTPFETLREAVGCAVAMERWHPEHDATLQYHPGVTKVDAAKMTAQAALGKVCVIAADGAVSYRDPE
ncbi:hypothetical protein KABACHOK_05030 [Brevundimonas phage vB_BpoS-Kabachok]|uniref:Uncharacterized protein n=1 Tax=Brevundimonas phage vB_BpoS-Kabachok TaxID=2948600 RepID=A0A9E7MRC6_9CAUD|nr:hypothetical protein KABACHOK_05030 [Brevundimonas phage vB_BpoS-Kabachok]